MTFLHSAGQVLPSALWRKLDLYLVLYGAEVVQAREIGDLFSLGYCSLSTIKAKTKDMSKGFYHRFLAILMHVGTFPYYRIFHFNTFRPIQLIAICTQQSSEVNRLLFLIHRWKRRKREELQFVSIAVSRVIPGTYRLFDQRYIVTHNDLTFGRLCFLEEQ